MKMRPIARDYSQLWKQGNLLQILRRKGWLGMTLEASGRPGYDGLARPPLGVGVTHGQDELLAAREAAQARYNHLLLSGQDDLTGGVFLEGGRTFVWGFHRTDIAKPVALRLSVDDKEIFSGVTSPEDGAFVYDAGYQMGTHRSMKLNVDGAKVEGGVFGAFRFWDQEAERDKLAQFVAHVGQTVHDGRVRDLVWSDLSNVSRRLRPDSETFARWRPSVYTSHMAGLFGLQQKLVDSQSVASWIVSDVMEDVQKRRRFLLTDELVALLNESLMNQSVIKYDITLALFAFWRRHYSHVDIFSPDGLRHVQYRFVTAPFIAEKNNKQLVTDSLRQALSAPADGHRSYELPWSRYWRLLLEDQKLKERLTDEAYLRTTSFVEVIHDIVHPSRLSFSPTAWRTYWAGGATADFTRFDLALISILANTDAPELSIAEQGTDYWRDRLQLEVYGTTPALSVMSATGRTNGVIELEAPEIPRHDLVIIGHGGETGLGRNLGMFVKALSSFKPLVFSADDGSCLSGGSEYNPNTGVRARTVLLCVNADRAPEMLSRFADICEDAYIIGFYLWESDHPPTQHALGAGAVDEIWTPTNYVADAYRKITSVPIHVIDKGLGKPLPFFPLLDRFRKDPGEFIFLTAAEFGSSIVRKNPLDVVRAFQAAFKGGDERVRLIVKIREVNPAHWSNIGSYWEDIEALIEDDDRISVLEGNLTAEEYWTLLKTSDAMVSLHRSEGFGYVVADAMLAEKAVIVSDYSGSQDFCDDHNAFLVPVKEVPVGPEYLRARGFIGQWGIPDIEAAARAMHQAVEDPELRASRAREGQVRVAKKYDFDAWAAMISQRIRAAIDRDDAEAA